jgi:hypothetical protein
VKFTLAAVYKRQVTPNLHAARLRELRQAARGKEGGAWLPEGCKSVTTQIANKERCKTPTPHWLPKFSAGLLPVQEIHWQTV